MNKTILCGRLGQAPELRTTQSGTSIAKFSLATSENYDNKQVTQWHNITVFGKQAEIAAKFLDKGRQVIVEGKITYSTYDKNDGTKGYSTDIICHNFHFVDSGSNKQEQATTEPQVTTEQQTTTEPQYADIPF